MQSSGRRNLALLGLLAILIATLATGLELWLYRSSGDIYLDRSRPGFLPDEKEAEEDADSASAYSYPETGSLDRAELTEYLDNLRSIETKLDKITDPYSSSPLSDQALGISATSE